MKIKSKIIPSIEKIFIDEEPRADELSVASALKGEQFSFQIALFQSDTERAFLNVEATSDLDCKIELFEVGCVPVTLPCYSDHDDNYLRTSPGLFPDILNPSNNEQIQLVFNQWKSLWITLKIPEDVKGDLYKINIRISCGDLVINKSLKLKVIDAILPKQKIIFTQWLHLDCLASIYKCEIFSEEHWKIIEQFMRNAVKFGINMILVPLLTPPLDTAVNSERPTVQLVDIKQIDGKYVFDFSKLCRYIRLAKACGIQYFEINHLFTQWGAKHAPKVIATENGKEKRIFGWETENNDPKYISFLQCLLPEFKKQLIELGVFNKSFFHISDEPSSESLDTYRTNVDNLSEVLKDCNTIDALSDYEFYKTGLVKNPIPATDLIEPFLQNNVENLWAYYCCLQYKKVSNHFIAMPGSRTRALATALYKYKIHGFLHWGFNFYYSQLSKKLIDPYYETSAVNAFPAGDAFIVYPGPLGNPISSIRQYLMLEVMQDLRAMELLESLSGYDNVLSVIEKYGEVTFKSYPNESQQIINIREDINRKIENIILSSQKQ